MRLIIIGGRSGSGKTIALQALEDLGFYCIDNLPVGFLPELKDHIAKHKDVAVGVDVRNIPADMQDFKKTVETLKTDENHCEVIYLETNNDVLLKRYSETRRKHPLTNSKTTLREAISKEESLLTPIANMADITIDTSGLTRQALQHLIHERLSLKPSHSLHILLQSFGFKHGLPSDADFVFDIRCLPNPYWQPELKDLTGLDDAVIDFLEKDPDFQKMCEDIHSFLQDWLPKFKADNRSYVSIAIGCTGGRHRSVYMAEKLKKLLADQWKNVQIRHRELQKISA